MTASKPSAAQPHCRAPARAMCCPQRPAAGLRSAAGRPQRAGRRHSNGVCRTTSKSSSPSGSERAELQLLAQQAVFGPVCSALANQLSQPEWFFAVIVLAALLAAALLAVLHLAPQFGLAMGRVFEAARCLTLQPQPKDALGVQDRLYRELVQECIEKLLFCVAAVFVAFAMDFVLTLLSRSPGSPPLLKNVLSNISTFAQALAGAGFAGPFLTDADSARKEHRKIRAAGGQPEILYEIITDFIGDAN